MVNRRSGRRSTGVTRHRDTADEDAHDRDEDNDHLPVARADALRDRFHGCLERPSLETVTRPRALSPVDVRPTAMPAGAASWAAASSEAASSEAASSEAASSEAASSEAASSEAASSEAASSEAASSNVASSHAAVTCAGGSW